jgi:hypothetical protein
MKFVRRTAECVLLDQRRNEDVLEEVKVDSIEIEVYEGVSKSFRTGRLEQELQMAHLCVTRCSCVAIL